MGMQFDGELIHSNAGSFSARVIPQCLDLIIDGFSNLTE